MIYTAIYMNDRGVVTHRTCPSTADRAKAWKGALVVAVDGECLVALVPGSHPVYTYSDGPSNIKSHDLFEIR